MIHQTSHKLQIQEMGDCGEGTKHTTVRDGQGGDIVHAYDALELAQLDPVVHLGCHEFFGHLLRIGEVDTLGAFNARLSEGRGFEVVKYRGAGFILGDRTSA
jgi:hypothetical protein